MRRPGGRAGRSSLRARLTLLATTLVAAVLLVSALALVAAQQRLLLRGVDEALVQRADNVQAVVARDPAGTVLPGEGDREDSFLQLVDTTGRLVAASPNVVGRPPAAPPLAVGASASFRTVADFPLSTHDYRVYARRVRTGAGDRTLLLGKNVDDVSESVRILQTSLAVAIPVVLALLAGLVWWLTWLVLRPVEAIRSEVAGITGADLHRRVPVQARDDEISSLARTMNAMLQRVQEATDRQRDFVADASHELRGPLTRLRSQLEVGLSHPELTPPEEAYRDLLTDTRLLQQLVDDLLFLARSESGVHPRPDAAVDLDDLVFEQAARLRARGKVHADVTAVSAGRVTGDRHQLNRALDNLVGNAERHAAQTVAFALREDGGRTTLTISDDGPGISADQAAAVFERFVRLDPARSRDDGGAGLGLPIVRDIVTRHGGTVAITRAPSGGARVTVCLPTPGRS